MIDELEAVDRAVAEAAGLTLMKSGPEVTDCVLTGEMPFEISVDGTPQRVALHFEIDLRRLGGPGERMELLLRLPAPAGSYEVVETSFEDGLERVNGALAPSLKLRCCLVCRWSAYVPYVVNTIGMGCYRDSRELLLRAETKHQVARVPVTERVPETYLCEEFERDEQHLRRDRLSGVTFRPLDEQ